MPENTLRGAAQKFCKFFLRLFLPVLFLIVAACEHESAPGTPYEDGDIFFPRQKPVNVVMEALMIGQLVEVGGCLRINGSESYLLVWPFDYSLNIRHGVIAVLDGAGRERVRVGDQIVVSGGEVKTLTGVGAVDDRLRQELAVRCPGPYWLVGAEVGKSRNLNQ